MKSGNVEREKEGEGYIIREGENIRKDSGRISGGGKRIFRVIFPPAMGPDRDV